MAAGLIPSHFRRGIFVVLSVLALLGCIVIYFETYAKCDMKANLTPMLLFTISVFTQHHIEYWLDYGTLLGAIREGEIVSWEFDLDLSTKEEQCSKIEELRPIFTKAGYSFYSKSDYIPEKANMVLGYDGWLHMPCIRIYDLNKYYYLDLYWYKIIPSDRVKQENVFLPSNYQIGDSEDLMCNLEGYDNNESGGCKRFSDIFPLRSIEFLGQQMLIPNNTDNCLQEMYGMDWRVPRPKGYKMVVCNFKPSPIYSYMLFAATTLPLILYAIWPILNRLLQKKLSRFKQFEQMS